MTFDVELTQTEFTEALLVAGRRARWIKAIYLILSGGVGMCTGYAEQKFSGGVLFGLGAGILALGVLTPLAYPNAIKKMWNKHPIYSEPRQYTIDDQGFHSKSYSGASTFSWHAFSHWTETSRLFLIYFGPSANYAVPKRCLTNHEQIKIFRDSLKEMIGRTKYAAPVRAFPVEPIESGDELRKKLR